MTTSQQASFAVVLLIFLVAVLRLIAYVAADRAQRRLDEERRARRARHACKVCCNEPSDTGELEHGRGCYEMSEDGGGTEWIDLDADGDLDIVTTRHD